MSLISRVGVGDAITDVERRQPARAMPIVRLYMAASRYRKNGKLDDEMKQVNWYHGQ
jgi:hypothetical protein